MYHPKPIVMSILFCLILFTFSAALTLPNPTDAQDTAWNATFLFQGEDSLFLQTVNANAVLETIPVSTEILGDGSPQSSAYITSADGRYIVHPYSLSGETTYSHVYFGATGDGPCCTDVADLAPTIIDYELGDFEPDGSRFALSYVQADQTGGIMVLDAAQGAIVADISMTDALAEINTGDIPNWAVLGRWTSEGILFIGTCYACGPGFIEGHYSVWNPDTGTVVADSGLIFGQGGSSLEGTGEFVRLGQDTRFPYEPSDERPIPNVIHYYANGDLADTPIPIYTDPQLPRLRRVAWVGDGQAILVGGTAANSWDIVFRDGIVERIQATFEPEFLGGTPDGWFAVVAEEGSRAVAHYSIQTLEPTIIAPFPPDAVSVQATYLPSLGQNVTDDPFVAITPSDVAQSVGCPGALPSRLAEGQTATVLDGPPNRLRAYPGTDAPIIGEIPSGAIFTILSGPECDGTTITWWYVEYEGNTGWTAEGQDDTYFVEPVE